MTNDTELPDNILTSPSTSAYLLSLGMNPNQVNIARSTASGRIYFATAPKNFWRASLLGRLSTGEWADVTGPLATTAVGAILGLEKVIVSQGWEVR